MTAPTSDERREVAELLREFVAVLEKFGDTDRLSADAIADLIDPTCTVRGYGHPDEFRVVKGCSACGCGWYEDVFDKPYAYCPNCGARVVDDD